MTEPVAVIGRPRTTPRLRDGFYFYEDKWWFHYTLSDGDHKRYSAKESICGSCGQGFPHRVVYPGRFCSPECYHADLKVRWYRPGEVKLNGDGYWLEKVAADDPLVCMARPGGWVLQHRLVKAREMGRPLERHESVHHRNGNRADNSSENLELRVGHHGPGASSPHCSTCSCFEH